MANVAFAVSSLSMGGIERVTTTIANGLAAQGHEVTLVNLSNRKEYFPVRTQYHLKPGWLSYNWWRVKRKLAYLSHGDTSMYTWGPWVSSQFNGGKYDFIILNPDFFIYYDIVKKLHPESKIYLWMHNNYDTYVSRYFKTKIDILEESVKQADGIICLESYSARRWRRWNTCVHVIHNPLTMDDDGAHSSLQSQTIACTSRLVKEQKGLDYLLTIAGELPEGWHIALAGDGQDRKWLQSEIVARGLESKLVLRGALNDELLNRHYIEASVFLSTSRWEGFPLVAAEAMSRGLPFVAFDIPAMREVTLNGKYGLLVPSGDTGEMSRALNDLIGSVDMRKQYADLSLERVKAFRLDCILCEWNKCLIQ
ncbi:glycosyl transferase group 1 [Bifidobacterium pseudolongum subsp. globosum]|uniref:glycosyltransferase n=3 Tax=Bifidobacterium pseudolongum TaxID=1694 RepID=UPI000C70399A|nr:glycosyltransferase [Bifidobacterium pseudolongum]PKV02761.1 glycosyl transferase group 1 [Bifidobacterium pseudolongum subsp. globosum]RYQ55730.1 glycosyl transferase group 1 [Bifidobacterium pseudolongum subsp. globosum]RYQ58736.1 glycosyl transferase group 1 [Bifidobacterium pseudolongum subsp. globosum]